MLTLNFFKDSEVEMCSIVYRDEPDIMPNSRFPFQDVSIKASGAGSSISCKENLVIRINSAYFGMQTKVNFYASGKGDYVYNVCYNRGVYSAVRNACEGKQTCLIPTAPGLDPCPGYGKKYYVTFYCVDNQTLNNLNNCGNTVSPPPDPCLISNYPTALNIIVGNNSSTGLTLSCPTGQSINVTCAFLGFDVLLNKTVSGAKYTTSAAYNTNYVFQTLTSLCNGKNSCFIFSNSTNFLHIVLIGLSQSNNMYNSNSVVQAQWTCL